MTLTRLSWSTAGVLVLGRAALDWQEAWGSSDSDPVRVVAKLLLALLFSAAIVRLIRSRQT